MSQYDPKEIFQFLSHTPEKGLRQLLIDGKTFTDSHLAMALKIVRTGNEESFCEHYTKTDFPKIKFSANELKLKETFWNSLTKAMASKGLITPTAKAA